MTQADYSSSSRTYDLKTLIRRADRYNQRPIFRFYCLKHFDCKSFKLKTKLGVRYTVYNVYIHSTIRSVLTREGNVCSPEFIVHNAPPPSTDVKTLRKSSQADSNT